MPHRATQNKGDDSLNSKEAAKIMDLPVDTLRYYERIGIMPPVERNQNGYRNYRNTDLNWIFIIKRLRESGLSIEALLEFATLTQSNGDTAAAKKDILTEQLGELDDKMADLEHTRNLLKYKIDTFDHHLGQFGVNGAGTQSPEKLWEDPRFNRRAKPSPENK